MKLVLASIVFLALVYALTFAFTLNIWLGLGSLAFTVILLHGVMKR